MITKELEEYIQLSLAKGIPYETIRTNLLTQGWHADEIQQAYSIQASQPLVSVLKPKRHIALKIVGAVLVLAGCAAAAYGYYTGYFLSLDQITSQSIAAARQAKSGVFDTTVAVTLPTPASDSLMASMLQSFAGTYSLTAKGTFDFNDEAHTKTASTISLTSNKFSTALELRATNGTLYARILKAPTMAFLPILSGMENKWVSFPYSNDTSSQSVAIPIDALVGVDTSIIDTLTDEQKQKFYDMTTKAHFIKITQRMLPEKIGDRLSYHFVFDIDHEGVQTYLQDVKEYINEIGKNDSRLSTFDPTSYTKELDSLKNFKGQLWIGRSDHLLYKVLATFDIEASDGTATPVSVASIFSDWNTPQPVEVPTGIITIEQLLEPLLGPSRNKGMDASIKSNLTYMRADAELYYDGHNGTYKGYCTSSTAREIQTQIKTSTSAFTCKDTSTQWVATAQMTDATYFCVDSTGQASPISVLPKATTCR